MSEVSLSQMGLSRVQPQHSIDAIIDERDMMFTKSTWIWWEERGAAEHARSGASTSSSSGQGGGGIRCSLAD